MNTLTYEPIYQSNTSHEILQMKLITGQKTLSDIKKKGNFGIGAPTLLIGELIFLDGKSYCISPQGNTEQLDENSLVPFAVVTNFTSNKSTLLKEETSYENLLTFLNSTLVRKDIPHAIKIVGHFKEVTVRSLRGVSSETIDLSNMDENRFVYKDLKGTMVGFYFPEYLSTVTTAGFHFHFLNEAKTKGGHLHNAQITDISITIQPASEFTIGFSQV